MPTFLELLEQVNKKEKEKAQTQISTNNLAAEINLMFATAEEKQIQQLLLDVCQQENIPAIQLFFKNTKTSSAVSITRSITIANHDMSAEKHPQYKFVVLLHEISHHILFDAKDFKANHNRKFQKIETLLCQKYLGLTPIFAQDRGYASGYLDKKTNVLVFDQFGYELTSPKCILIR